jgi:hypothetical protein
MPVSKVSITVCGTPFNDGIYTCPLCHYSSDNIEDFAVGMCWNCVYNYKEDNLSTQNEMVLVTDINQIKPGMKVRAERTATVAEVIAYDKAFRTTDGRVIRIGGNDIHGKPLPKFDVYMEKPVFDIKDGDVYRDVNGDEYHVLGNSVFDTKNNYLTLVRLTEKIGLKLTYRKGQ